MNQLLSLPDLGRSAFPDFAPPSCVVARFSLVADPCAQLLARVVGALARLDLLPDALRVAVLPDAMRVDMDITVLTALQAEIFAERLRMTFGVRTVSLDLG